MGTLVLQQTVLGTIDVSSLEKGMYFVQLNANGKTTLFKMVKN
jgi:hypothetical protein